MNLAGCHFTYANTASSTYSLWFAHCDTSEYTPINGQTKTVGFFNKRDKRSYFITDDLEGSPVSIDVEILTDNDVPLTLQNTRAVESWLFNKKGYYKLFVDIADDCTGETYQTINGTNYRFYFNCRFTNPKKIYGNGGITGFRATMECDSPLLWQETLSSTFAIGHTASTDSTAVSLAIDSDMNEYVYPKVTFQIGNTGGNITVTNSTDDVSRLTTFKSLTASIQLVMNGNLNYISGENYKKFYDKNFIRLLPGTNSLTIVGHITSVTFEWTNRKYM